MLDAEKLKYEFTQLMKQTERPLVTPQDGVNFVLDHLSARNLLGGTPEGYTLVPVSDVVHKRRITERMPMSFRFDE